MSDGVYDSGSDGDCDQIIHKCPHLQNILMARNDAKRGMKCTKLILTRLNTFLDRSLSVSKVLRLECKRMNEALDNAMSPVIELGWYALY